jgi:hypothetical protein
MDAGLKVFRSFLHLALQLVTYGKLDRENVEACCEATGLISGIPQMRTRGPRDSNRSGGQEHGR